MCFVGLAAAWVSKQLTSKRSYAPASSLSTYSDWFFWLAYKFSAFLTFRKLAKPLQI